MADISDVLTALVNLATPGAVSASGGKVILYPGWPISSRLDDDMAAGKSHVSVYPRPEERLTTRYQSDWQTVSITTPTLTLSKTFNSVTVGGTVSVPQNATLIVNGNAYSYGLVSADTLTSVASALAALVNANTPATSTGATVSIPGAYSIVARVGTTGTSIKELRRQERTFQIVIWAPTPSARDSIAKAIDTALAALNFITLADGTAARLIYKGSSMTDQLSKARIYRRDLMYCVEYATTQTLDSATVTDFQAIFSDKPSGVTAPISNFTINL